MKSLLAVAILFWATTSVANEITNMKASLVLDGGSYLVTLLYGKEELRVLIMNPSRRQKPTEVIWLLDEKSHPKQIISCDSKIGQNLHTELLEAAKSEKLSAESKTICYTVDRLLQNPAFPWSQVSFPEKWE
jgi:hypothetical protein